MMRFFAHAGGWDELLFFGVPVIVAITAVRWAEKRTKRRIEQERVDAAPAPEPDESTP
ncbi:MAG: hypothetical protein HKN07_04430 [Acidimicrobiia bacterium]|nr:hypothetical protein [Acidimicrobiia bacterium]